MKGIAFGTKIKESLNDTPFKLVEVGNIMFVNEVITKYFHEGYDPIGLASDNGVWYILIRKRVGKGFEYI